MLKLMGDFFREGIQTFRAIRSLIWFLMVVPSGLGKTRQVGEIVMAKEIHFKTERDILAIDPAIVSAKGIVKQRHRVVLEDVEIHNEDFPVTGGVSSFVVGPAGKTYVEMLDYFDAAGNDSIDLVTTPITVVDGVAPDAPVAFGATRQVEEVEVGEDDPVDDEEDSEGDVVDEEDIDDEDLEDDEDDIDDEDTDDGE